MIQRIKLKRKLIIGVLLNAGIAVLGLNHFVDFSFQGHLQGIYLLKGQGDKPFQFADDIYSGEEEKVLAWIDFEWFYNLLQANYNQGQPYLELGWNDKEGSGTVRNYLGGDKILMTSFSRYSGSDNQRTQGLFIGGALPDALLDGSINNSGMSYFDGQRWSHIWCNTNEGIGSTVVAKGSAPSAWRFLGSRIVSRTAAHVVLNSEHEIEVDGVVLRMERTVEMTAGVPDLTLTVKISNSDNGVGQYFYYYGDEPWLGDFGSSSGDVGWVSGRLIEFEESIDPKSVSYAGMADYGSSVLGEGHQYGHMANFIQWLGPDKPDIVFFANNYAGFNHDPQVRVPLHGNGRSIGMYWGPRKLLPGQAQAFSLVIGMAEQDPVTGVPRLPTSVVASTAKLAVAN